MKNNWVPLQAALRWPILLSTAFALAACQPAENGPPETVIREHYKVDEQAFGKIAEIRRGEPMAATGEGGIPENTTLYPVRVRIIPRDGSPPYDSTSYFYQNEFREWNAQDAALEPR